MATLKLDKLNKIYDNKVHAVYDFDLEVQDKEFIVLVGPSGCGKSTTLRMIAGLEEISSGELYINDRLVNYIDPKDRDIAMVFQNYALYPHMSVYENLAFGLKLKKIKKDEINRRIKETAEILEISDYLDRRPKQLSGGQRQRVALGRAIVRNAQVFLMDEPLSNLDAKLRVQMRSEIITIHEKIQATTIYVTHDQTEAMTMATRIVVMKDGYIQQIGTPKEIYNHPSNMFVAGFIGSPAMNFLHGEIRGGKFYYEDNCFTIPEMFKDVKKTDHQNIVLGIRPEDLQYEGIVAETFPDATFSYTIDVAELLGNEFILHGTVGKQNLVAKIASRADVKNHQTLKLTVDLSKIHFFDQASEEIMA